MSFGHGEKRQCAEASRRPTASQRPQRRRRGVRAASASRDPPGGPVARADRVGDGPQLGERHARPGPRRRPRRSPPSPRPRRPGCRRAQRRGRAARAGDGGDRQDVADDARRAARRAGLEQVGVGARSVAAPKPSSSSGRKPSGDSAPRSAATLRVAEHGGAERRPGRRSRRRCRPTHDRAYGRAGRLGQGEQRARCRRRRRPGRRPTRGSTVDGPAPAARPRADGVGSASTAVTTSSPVTARPVRRCRLAGPSRSSVDRPVDVVAGRREPQCRRPPGSLRGRRQRRRRAAPACRRAGARAARVARSARRRRGGRRRCDRSAGEPAPRRQPAVAAPAAGRARPAWPRPTRSAERGDAASADPEPAGERDEPERAAGHPGEHQHGLGVGERAGPQRVSAPVPGCVASTASLAMPLTIAVTRQAAPPSAG